MARPKAGSRTRRPPPGKRKARGKGHGKKGIGAGPSGGRARKIDCTVCGAKLKPENLDSHMERVHPEGEASQEASQAKLQRKMIARRANFKRALQVAVPVVIAALLVGVVYYLAFVHEMEDDGPPAWKLESHNGVIYDSDDYYKTNKLTLIQFVHTDSASCHHMASRMFDIWYNYFNFTRQPENKAKLTKVFSIGGYKLNDTWDDKDELTEFRQGYGNWWPFLYDVKNDLMDQYGFTEFPSFVLIKNNKVVFRHEGLISRWDMYDELDRHMGPPPWTLKDTNGQSYDSVDYYKEGLTLVEFMHTKCGSCKDSADDLRGIHNQYGTQLNGMFTIGGYPLSTDLDTGSTLHEFKLAYGHDWPYLYDEEGDLLEDYNIARYPTLVLIKNNEVVYRHSGEVNFDEVSEKIELHL